jgi:hypothetical protein
MRDGKDWLDVSTEQAPRLVLGWRPRPRNLEAARVEVHEDAAEGLEEVAAGALQRLSELSSVDFGPAVLPEPGEEYLRLPISELPPRAPRRRPPPRPVGPKKGAAEVGGPRELGIERHEIAVQVVAPALTDAGAGHAPTTTDESSELADVLRIVRDPDSLPAVSAGQLQDGDFAFYAICFPQPGGEVITMVRGMSPTRTLRRGAFFGRFAGSLRRAERPDLLLEAAVDLVITGDEVAILNRTAYDRLFSDLDTIALAVPGNVAAVSAAMPKLRFAPGTTEALTALCMRLPSLAKRLSGLANNPGLDSLDSVALRVALVSHNEDPDPWLDANGELTLTEDRARHFLDVVEGRWWTSDFTGERRRADRFRQR